MTHLQLNSLDRTRAAVQCLSFMAASNLSGVNTLSFSKVLQKAPNAQLISLSIKEIKALSGARGFKGVVTKIVEVFLVIVTFGTYQTQSKIKRSAIQKLAHSLVDARLGNNPQSTLPAAKQAQKELAIACANFFATLQKGPTTDDLRKHLNHFLAIHRKLAAYLALKITSSNVDITPVLQAMAQINGDTLLSGTDKFDQKMYLFEAAAKAIAGTFNLHFLSWYTSMRSAYSYQCQLHDRWPSPFHRALAALKEGVQNQEATDPNTVHSFIVTETPAPSVAATKLPYIPPGPRPGGASSRSRGVTSPALEMHLQTLQPPARTTIDVQSFCQRIQAINTDARFQGHGKQNEKMRIFAEAVAYIAGQDGSLKAVPLNGSGRTAYLHAIGSQWETAYQAEIAALDAAVRCRDLSQGRTAKVHMRARAPGTLTAQDRIEIANETLAQLPKHPVPRVYSVPYRGRLSTYSKNPSIHPIKLISSDTLDAGRGSRNPLYLIMANAKDPGGGFLTGAMAQEEEMFRRATLGHMTRESTRGFYPIFDKALYVTDGLILRQSQSYAPLQVPRAASFVFSNAEQIGFDQYHLHMIPEGKNASTFIHQTGPNGVKWHYDPEYVTFDPETGTWKLTDEYREKLKEKVVIALKLAQENGHDTLVYGALGCGAFGNPPEEVAQIISEAYHDYGGDVRLVLAILNDHNTGQPHNPRGNFAPFADLFGSSGHRPA